MPAAIVTGGGGAIGRATCLELARLGFDVLVVGRSAGSVEATVAAANALDRAAAAGFVGDVAADGVASAYTAACTTRFGPPDALVSAAGVEGPVEPVERYPLAEFDHVMAVNVRGTFLGMQAVLSGMIERGAGRIVNLSSQAGVRGVPGVSAYAASKHAVLGLSRSAALEAAPHGVSVNTVCPGPTATDMMVRVEAAVAATGGDPQGLLDRIPTGRYTRPEEVGQLLGWLASEAPPALTGATLSVDGGMTAG